MIEKLSFYKDKLWMARAGKEMAHLMGDDEKEVSLKNTIVKIKNNIYLKKRGVINESLYSEL